MRTYTSSSPAVASCARASQSARIRSTPDLGVAVHVPVFTSPSGRLAVVTPEGELDLASVGGLRDALLQACDSSCRVVVVDFGRVSFADSSALAVLAMAAKKLADNHRRLAVVNVGGLPLKVLRLSGLDAVVDVHPTEQPLEDVLAQLDAAARGRAGAHAEADALQPPRR
jgi:anti-anti-sigma factor